MKRLISKRIIVSTMAAVVIASFSLTGCDNSSADNNRSFASTDEIVSITVTVTEDEKFHGILLSVTNEEFNKAGFSLGDSCDIVFENNRTIMDVPYYDGYYGMTGTPVIVNYSGSDAVKINYINGEIWDDMDLENGDSVTITLNEAGKYSDIQELVGQSYSSLREDYNSDEDYCNFRVIAIDDLKENLFYRGVSPVEYGQGRAVYADHLLSRYGIKTILNLSDNAEKIKGYFEEKEFNSNYTKKLYEKGNIVTAGLSANFESSENKEKITSALKQIINFDGPIYIHCSEGKIRTGFVCMLLEALAGADYYEMCNDYMKTYECFYDVTEEKTPDKYNAIKKLYFDGWLSMLHGSDDEEELKTADFTEDAKNYLLEGGMSPTEVEQLREYITK